MARYKLLRVLRVYNADGADESDSRNASVPSRATPEEELTVPERKMLNLWARTCPSLEIVELASGHCWIR